MAINYMLMVPQLTKQKESKNYIVKLSRSEEYFDIIIIAIKYIKNTI